MREKGGLHMEKMEHMDPQRCDRIWQRVSPELDPYPEVRAARRMFRVGEAILRTFWPKMKVVMSTMGVTTHATKIPAVPMEPAESGCCLAGRAMGSIRLIQDFIEDELADRRAYLAYAAFTPDESVRLGMTVTVVWNGA